MKPFLTLIAIFFAIASFAQNQDPLNETVTKEFLILHSGKDYNKALAIAKSASTKLGLKMDLRNLKPNKELGLSDSRSECEGTFGFYPCYVPRGHYEDGAYISIEYSSSFLGFKEGYYIVVAASYELGNAQTKPMLTKAKKIIKDAYVKQSKVYTGCIH